MPGSPIFFDILALLLAAVVLVPAFHRFGIPSVLAYLIAGIILGPYTPGPVVDVEATRPLAEFGVVFLLFAIGLELPLSRLKTMRGHIFGLGLLQVVLTALVLGGGALLAGLPPALAIVIGITLSMSSTAAVLSLLNERGETVDHHGRVAVAVLIFQDLAVIPLLTLLPMLNSHGHDVAALLGMTFLKAGLAVAAILLLGRLVLRPAYAFVAASRNPEVFVAANLLLVLAIAWLTDEAGMSMGLGAFLGGLMLADTPYRHQIEADIQPFRGLLLGLFFMTVGMSLNIPFVIKNGFPIIGLTFLLMLAKAALILGLCRLFKIGLAQGLKIGFLLAQTGEFAFVVFEQAAKLRLLDNATGQTLLAVTSLSLLATPLAAKMGWHLSRHQGPPDGKQLQPKGFEDAQGHVVIAGYGRMGRALGRLLKRHDIPFLALDTDVERVTKAHEQGLPVYFGDASHTGVLRSVGIQGAKAMVITISLPRFSERAIACVRQMAPAVPVIVRAMDRLHEEHLNKIGATVVVPETVEASLQVAGQVLRAAGIAESEVKTSLEDYRNHRYGKAAPPTSSSG
jgi:CPA2 family monovalent cation:H+ antiporter-2